MNIFQMLCNTGDQNTLFPYEGTGAFTHRNELSEDQGIDKN